MKVFYTDFCNSGTEAVYRKAGKYFPVSFRERLHRLYQDTDKMRFLLGRMLLIKALEEYGFNPEVSGTIKLSAHGKPYLPGEDFYFNISHSGNYVICAAMQGSDIGVDVEQMKPIELETVRRVMNDKEWEEIDNSSNPEETFYRYWCMKEAAVKADGRGFFIESEQVTVEGESVFISGECWCLKELSLHPEYKMYLAFKEPVTPLEIIRMPVDKLIDIDSFPPWGQMY